MYLNLTCIYSYLKVATNVTKNITSFAKEVKQTYKEKNPLPTSTEHVAQWIGLWTQDQKVWTLEFDSQ